MSAVVISVSKLEIKYLKMLTFLLNQIHRFVINKADKTFRKNIILNFKNLKKKISSA